MICDVFICFPTHFPPKKILGAPLNLSHPTEINPRTSTKLEQSSFTLLQAEATASVLRDRGMGGMGGEFFSPQQVTGFFLNSNKSGKK